MDSSETEPAAKVGPAPLPTPPAQEDDAAINTNLERRTAADQMKNRKVGGRIIRLDCDDLDLPPEAYSTFHRRINALQTPAPTINPRKLHSRFFFFYAPNHHRAVEMHPPWDGRGRRRSGNVGNVVRNTTSGLIAAPGRAQYPGVPYASHQIFQLNNIQFPSSFERPPLGTFSLTNPHDRPRLSVNKSGSAEVNTGAIIQTRAGQVPATLPNASPPPPDAPMYVPAGGYSPYKPWDDLPPEAKLTTSAAARQARKKRYWRDENTINRAVANLITEEMEKLTGEIYDAITDVSEALDAPGTPGMALLTQSASRWSITASKIVAMAYWVAVSAVPTPSAGRGR